MSDDYPFRRERAVSRPLLKASRTLRREQTEAERILREKLRGRNLAGTKFRRQAVLDRFVLNFYCHEYRLSIELDGPIHLDPDVAAHDAERQAIVEARNICVLRFTNEQVIHHIDEVLATIRQYLTRKPSRG